MTMVLRPAQLLMSNNISIQFRGTAIPKKNQESNGKDHEMYDKF